MNLAKGKIDVGEMDIGTPDAIGAALDWCYGGKLSLRDAMLHAVAAWHEAGADRRYEMGRTETLDLVLAPVTGTSSIDLLGPRSLETSYTVGEFYRAMLMKIMGDLQVTRCDWCREHLDLALEKAAAWEGRTVAAVD
jgi:hypothetical protein